MYLDPIKVTLLTPGMKKDGTMDEFGIPASIVAKYLDEHGIVVEKPVRTTCCSCSVSVSTKPKR
jgi:lysine decarboxylase